MLFRSLLNLPTAVQKRLAAGTLSMGHARALLGLSDPVEIERIATKIINEGLSVRATEELISQSAPTKKKNGGRPGSRHGKFQELEERIENVLDTRVSIKGGASGGKIQIEFADSEDLRRITEVITGK